MAHSWGCVGTCIPLCQAPGPLEPPGPGISGGFEGVDRWTCAWTHVYMLMWMLGARCCACGQVLGPRGPWAGAPAVLLELGVSDISHPQLICFCLPELSREG